MREFYGKTNLQLEELIEDTLKSDNYLKDYAKSAKAVISLYKDIFTEDGKHSTIVHTLKMVTVRGKKIPAISELFYQDILDLLTTPAIVDFNKYSFLERQENQTGGSKVIKLTIKESKDPLTTISDELEVIFAKIGIKGAVTILKYIKILDGIKK